MFVITGAAACAATPTASLNAPRPRCLAGVRVFIITSNVAGTVGVEGVIVNHGVEVLRGRAFRVGCSAEDASHCQTERIVYSLSPLTGRAAGDQVLVGTNQEPLRTL